MPQYALRSSLRLCENCGCQTRPAVALCFVRCVAQSAWGLACLMSLVLAHAGVAGKGRVSQADQNDNCGLVWMPLKLHHRAVDEHVEGAELRRL
jgi:hypothetical protein